MIKQILATCFAAASLSACAQEADVAPAPEPTPISTAEGFKGDTWRKITPENLVLMQTQYGEIVIELNPEFAPGAVQRFQEMIKALAFNNKEFYRVIDGFVAQAGLNEQSAKWPPIEIEAEQPVLDSDDFQRLGNPDIHADDVGFINGFATGMNDEASSKWLLHCPGAIAMARGQNPNSGGTDFYIVLDSQRYLDRNMSVFGRVISGMQYIQKLKRGDRNVANGVIQAPDKGDQIFSMKLVSELPENEQPHYEVMHSETPDFMNIINSQRVKMDPFFFNTPPQVVDICDVDIPVELVDF